MSVRKVGSKLAQGVRQVRAQQATAPTVVEAPNTQSVATPVAPAPSAAKPVAKRKAVKPAAGDAGSPGMLHPSRVWPD